ARYPGPDHPGERRVGRAHHFRVPHPRAPDAARRRRDLQDRTHRAPLRPGLRTRQQRHRGAGRPAAPQARSAGSAAPDRDAARPRLPLRTAPRRFLLSGRIAAVHTLSRRLLVSVSLPLALFFGIMMWVLDTGFRALSERSLQELLDSQMVSLIASAEPQPDGSYAPTPQTLDPRLATPRSGFYAEISSQQHQWRSPSTAGLQADFGTLLTHGERNLVYATFSHEGVAIESRAIQFDDDPSGANAL